MKKTVKSILLAGMAGVAAVTGYKMGQKSTAEESAKPVAHSHTEAKYQRVSKYYYELRGGVLMPVAGETREVYEERRIHAEEEASRLEKDGNAVVYYSYYSKEGQRRLKEYNRNLLKVRKMNQEIHDF